MLCVLVPSAVRELRGEAMLFSVVLTWSEPVPLNGILNRYTIRYSVNGSSEITNTTENTTFSITDLDPNTVVSNIRVIAATGAGDGPPQMLTDITTLDRPGRVLYNDPFHTYKIYTILQFLLLNYYYYSFSNTNLNPITLVMCLSKNGKRPCLVRLHKTVT